MGSTNRRAVVDLALPKRRRSLPPIARKLRPKPDGHNAAPHDDRRGGGRVARARRPVPESNESRELLRKERDAVARQLRACFRHFDADGSGKLTADSLVQAMRMLGVSASDATLHAVAAGASSSPEDTRIDYVEFADLLASDAGRPDNLGFFSNEMVSSLNVLGALGRRGAHSDGAASGQHHAPPPPTKLQSRVARAKAAAAAIDAAKAADAAAAVGAKAANDTEAVPAQEAAPVGVIRTLEADDSDATAEKAAGVTRRKVSHALMALRDSIETAGAITAVFRCVDAERPSSLDADAFTATMRKLGVELEPHVRDLVMAELDLPSDEAVDYRKLATSVLTNLGVDNTRARGLNGGAPARRPKVPLRAAPPRLESRLAAVGALQAARKALLASGHSDVTAALLAAAGDAAEEGSTRVPYANFYAALRRQVPRLDEGTAAALCRMVDTNNLGVVDLADVGAAVGSSGNDVSQVSASALARRYEQRALLPRRADGGIGAGRFAATPVGSYGLQVRELIYSFPGSAQYADDKVRLAREPSHDKGRCTWQADDVAAAARRKAARSARREGYWAALAERRAKDEAKAAVAAEGRTDARFQQKQRYITSIAMDRNIQRQLLGSGS